LWAVARYDLGLSYEEFGEITPGMFHALCERKRIRYKYERLAHAITASAVYNVNRKQDSPVIQPMDFIVEKTREQEELEEIKKVIKTAITAAPAGTSREVLLKMKANVIKSLNARGRTDSEKVFDSCWPSLKE
jgi:hypothetical protein